MRKKILIFIVFTIILSLNPKVYTYSFVDDNVAKSLLAANAENGDIYVSKNIDEVYAVASMSKLMTYLIVKDEIKKGNIDPQEMVKVTQESSKLNTYEYSRMYLEEGDHISVNSLIEGLMIVSANDAANALAIRAAGSLEKFNVMMNQKAKEIGLKTAVFVNPSGITEEDTNGKLIYNKMSARDMFNLSRHIIKSYPEVFDFSKFEKWSIPEKPGIEREPFFNDLGKKSKLGLKSGYTEEAGYSYAGYFDFSLEDTGNDLKIITVVMGTNNRNERDDQTLKLANHIQENYIRDKVLSSNRSFISIYDKNTKQKNIHLYPVKDLEEISNVSDITFIGYTIYGWKKAPYVDSEEMGELFLNLSDGSIENVKLINKGYIPKSNFFTRFFDSLKQFFKDINTLM